MASSFQIPVRALVFSVAAALISGFASGPAPAAAGGPFLSHQALYELKLVKSRGSNAITGARGRILYNFSGSACEGYTSEFRQVSELDSGEGKLTLSDLRSHSWEDAAGKSYRFKIDTRMNDTDAMPVDGVAERVGDRVTVKLKQPVAKTFELDGKIVFPTEQIQHIIAAAREGKSVLELMVYDGSDNGEKVYNTLSVIGQPIPEPQHRFPRSLDRQRPDEDADPLARDRELLRPRCQDEGRRADAGLRDVVRAVRERRLPRAGARLQRLRDRGRDGPVRRQGFQAV